MSIEKTMLSCEDKLQGAAENLMGVSKSFQQMGLMDRIRAEVVLLNDIATAGIRIELGKKQPNEAQIIKELKMSIADGYKGLSINLSNEILNF